MSKEEIRKEKLAKRLAMTPGIHAGKSAVICEDLLGYLKKQNPRCVGGYMPCRNEADILPLLSDLHAQGVSLALPVMQKNDRKLLFRAWKPGDPLVPNQYGILEPGADAALVTPDVMLVPCVAFDEYGYRVGYGKGCYDETLKSLRGEKPIYAIGVAFDFQKAPVIPIEKAFDVALDKVITEAGRQIGWQGNALDR